MVAAVLAALALLVQQSPGHAPMGQDAAGRPVIAVSVDGGEPLDFVVDTAASQHVVMPRLVERMALESENALTEVQGAGGRQSTRQYKFQTLSSAAFALADVQAVELPNGTATDVWGIVGMSDFTRRRVSFDRRDMRFSLLASGPAEDGVATVRATMRGAIAVVNLQIDGVRVQAVIDSGAARSVANPALLSALGWRDDDPRLSEARPIQGATTQPVVARLGRVEELRLGPVVFTDVTVTFSDLPVFRALRLGDQPALILGSDILNRFDSYAIDYPRRELQFRTAGNVAAPSPER